MAPPVVSQQVLGRRPLGDCRPQRVNQASEPHDYPFSLPIFMTGQKETQLYVGHSGPNPKSDGAILGTP